MTSAVKVLKLARGRILRFPKAQESRLRGGGVCKPLIRQGGLGERDVTPLFEGSPALLFIYLLGTICHYLSPTNLLETVIFYEIKQ